jgi:secreted trypsin-like serine protease
MLLVILIGFAGTNAQIENAQNCLLHDGTEGVCTPLNKCTWIKEEISSGKMTLNQIVNCGFTINQPIICCRPTKRKSEIACDLIKKIPKAERNHDNDLQVNPGEFPHLIALGYFNEIEQRYIYSCSGSLISKKIVLTSAQCIDGPPYPTIVTLGKISLSPTDKFPGESPRHMSIENTTMHPDYIFGKSYHDFALIELSMPVTYSSAIRPACLFPVNLDIESFDLTFAGFDKMGKHKYNSISMLLKSNLEFVDQKSCEHHFQSWNFPEISDGIKASQLCATMVYSDINHISPCLLNSGGPVQTQIDGENYVIGVEAFKTPFCQEQIMPGIFTKVTEEHLNWIESVAWPKEVDI